MDARGNRGIRSSIADGMVKTATDTKLDALMAQEGDKSWTVEDIAVRLGVSVREARLAMAKRKRSVGR